MDYMVRISDDELGFITSGLGLYVQTMRKLNPDLASKAKVLSDRLLEDCATTTPVQRPVDPLFQCIGDPNVVMPRIRFNDDEWLYNRWRACLVQAGGKKHELDAGQVDQVNAAIHTRKAQILSETQQAIDRG